MKYGISNKKGNKSVYYTVPKTLYVYEEKLRKEFNGNFTILIPNCMDAYSVLPLLRKNHYVDCYEMNNILIEGGYIYLFYYIADNENDYEKYPENSYLRTHEMKSFFDRDNWEIIYSVENHIRQYSLICMMIKFILIKQEHYLLKRKIIDKSINIIMKS